MRTLDEIERSMMHTERLGGPYKRVFIDELRHLLAIARAADVNCFDCSKCAVGERLAEARKAGMFGGGG